MCFNCDKKEKCEIIKKMGDSFSNVQLFTLIMYGTHYIPSISHKTTSSTSDKFINFWNLKNLKIEN